MIAALLLLLQAVPALPPADWSTLPRLPVPLRARGEADPAAFVRAEVAAGRCHAAPAEDGRTELAARLAVRIDDSGTVRQIVPQAIGCPTVEQYTVGYMSTLIRRSLGSDDPPAPGWYVVPVAYRW